MKRPVSPALRATFEMRKVRTRDAILRTLRGSHEGLQATDLAPAAGLSEATVRRHLRVLEGEGLVRSEPTEDSLLWTIAAKEGAL